MFSQQDSDLPNHHQQIRNLAKRFSSPLNHIITNRTATPIPIPSCPSKTLSRARKTKSIQQLFTYSSQLLHNRFMGNVNEDDVDEPSSPGALSFWCRGGVSSTLSLLSSIDQDCHHITSKSILTPDHHSDGLTLCGTENHEESNRRYHVYSSTDSVNDDGVDRTLITGQEWDDVT